MKKVFVIALSAIILLCTACSGGSKVVSDVKALSVHEAEALLGEIFDVILEETTWSAKKRNDGDSYIVTVSGTIHEDIPQYRECGGKPCYMDLIVEYHNEILTAEISEGSFGDIDLVGDMMPLIGAYRMAVGQGLGLSVLDETYITTNQELPIYQLYQEVLNAYNELEEVEVYTESEYEGLPPSVTASISSGEAWSDFGREEYTKDFVACYSYVIENNGTPNIVPYFYFYEEVNPGFHMAEGYSYYDTLLGIYNRKTGALTLSEEVVQQLEFARSYYAFENEDY